MLLAGRLVVPEGTRALLFDLDGVLIDSLSLDYEIVSKLLEDELGTFVDVPRSVIRENFPLAIPDFWRMISKACSIELSSVAVSRLAEKHESERRDATFIIHDGIKEILDAARNRDLAVGVVSNNPEIEVRAGLSKIGIVADVIVGNDEAQLRKKPAADTYEAAASRLGIPPSACVAVEDSLLGAEAANTAGCFTVAVATGANSFEELSNCKYVDSCFSGFATCYVALGREGVTKKRLLSPNDFVSHMVEHVAWRMGCSIDLSWTNNDWHELGLALGREVCKYPRLRDSAATIGMIDDGSAEIIVKAKSPGGVSLTSSRQVDLEWFLCSRAEQLSDGKPLVKLLQGLGVGADLQINVTVSAFEDPHHTWEGVFRGVGIAIDKMINTYVESPEQPIEVEAVHSTSNHRFGPFDGQRVEQGWTVKNVSAWEAHVERRTAESAVAVDVGVGSPTVRCSINVADSVNVSGMADLLADFAEGATLRVDVNYEATRLSSSHVVTEDIGMTLGRALRLLAVERMERFGIQGAGSNIETLHGGEWPSVRVGVSMEGRKFWKYVPMSQDYADFRKAFLIGHTLSNGLFSEDLDDFVDGLAGGLQSSIIVHVDSDVNPISGWPMLFRGLGCAIAGLLVINPYRLGLTPGVKATLA